MDEAPGHAVAPPPPPSGRIRPASLGVRALAIVLLGVSAWYGVMWGISQYHQWAAAGHLRHREFDKALENLAWARWAWPSNAESWFLSARSARRAGQFEQASEWLDRAHEKGARPRLVLLERTLLLAKRGHFAEVEGKLHDLLRASRYDYPFIAEVLTDEYMRQYRFRESRALLNRWIEIGGEAAEGRLRRAWVADHQFDFEQALRDYHEVLRLEPGRDQVRLRVAEILLEQRQPVQALEELSPLLRSETVLVRATLLASRCERERGRPEEAARLLDALPEADREAPEVVAERGQVALRRDDWPAAEAFLRRAGRDLPRNVELLYGLQQALSRQGKSAEAEEVARSRKRTEEDTRRMGELVKKLGQDPANAELRFECAEIFLRNGMIDDATRWLEMTLEVQPGHEQARKQLATCRNRQAAKDRDPR